MEAHGNIKAAAATEHSSEDAGHTSKYELPLESDAVEPPSKKVKLTLTTSAAAEHASPDRTATEHASPDALMVKAVWKKADTIDHQLQILVAQARKCERDDLGPKQMIPEDEEQKQEWEANCERVRLFLRTSLSSVDEEILNTMLADARGLKSMCRTLHLKGGGYDLEPPPQNAAETVASAIDHDELNAFLGHGQ